VLGVPRAATRDEIARAHRALVKRSHPDAGGATSSAEMAAISEAWRILGDPVRRARWNREHLVSLAPPRRAPSVAAPRVVRPVAADAPPARMDSAWIAAAVVAGIAVLVGGLMLGVSLLADPAVARTTFVGEELRFDYPDAWQLAEGDGADPGGHRVIAHLLSFGVAPEEHCISFTDRCRWTGDVLPAGGASVLVTAWEGGEPAVPEPLTRRPYGLDADAMIGGAPAASDGGPTGEDSFFTWWQLSPPGFPDRWIEVRANIRGGELEQARRMAEVDALLDSIEFED